jgi:hypothetical protein
VHPVYLDRLVKDRQAELQCAAGRRRVPSSPGTNNHRLLAIVGRRFGFLLMRIGQRLVGAADAVIFTDSQSNAARLSQGHR